jgi:intracellular sulfur oxidation DsrE/DsrF family protein
MKPTNDDMHIKLNGLADGELDARESEALLEQVESDSELREELCDIHRLKDMVRYAYSDESISPQQRQPQTRWRFAVAAAAVLFFTMGFMGGRMIAPTDVLAPFELGAIEPQPNKIVLFVGYSDQKKFEQVLDRAELLLQQYAGEGAEVNVVASAGGIDLLSKVNSPYLERIESLSANYAALQFVACNNTLARMAREGKPVMLVDSAMIRPSAVQFVVERLQQGWSYVAI